jgi:ADP-ribose pyrophosphatase YjhB (NUDIX family)
MSSQQIDENLDKIIDALYRVSAKAVIVQDNKILLVKENIHDWWGLPGGGVDHGESASEALHREITEELGLSPGGVTIHDQALQAIIGNVVDHIPRVAILYKVDIPTDAKLSTTDHVQEYKWYSALELKDLYVTQTVGGAAELSKYLSA